MEMYKCKLSKLHHLCISQIETALYLEPTQHSHLSMTNQIIIMYLKPMEIFITEKKSFNNISDFSIKVK